MQPFRAESDKFKLQRPPELPIAPEWLVGLATVPLLGGLVLAHTAQHWLIQVGVASEELFRGERLPVLNVPPDISKSSPSADD
ncbi:MAG: hypothetical protein AAFV72_07335 [Cyanobacteria bacterium J06635_1]